MGRSNPSPDKTTTGRLGFGGRLSFVRMLVGVILVCAACGSTKAAGGSSPPAPSTVARAASEAPSQSPLSAPKTTPAQDAQYFEDLARADPALATYVQTQGDIALRALLTDGSAFCAFLQRGGGIDTAMASLVEGANTVESQTHLPSNVTTFNAIDAVALLALCPAEQTLVPASDRAKINQLGLALGSQSS